MDHFPWLCSFTGGYHTIHYFHESFMMLGIPMFWTSWNITPIYPLAIPSYPLTFQPSKAWLSFSWTIRCLAVSPLDLKEYLARARQVLVPAGILQLWTGVSVHGGNYPNSWMVYKGKSFRKFTKEERISSKKRPSMVWCRPEEIFFLSSFNPHVMKPFDLEPRHHSNED